MLEMHLKKAQHTLHATKHNTSAQNAINALEHNSRRSKARDPGTRLPAAAAAQRFHDFALSAPRPAQRLRPLRGFRSRDLS